MLSTDGILMESNGLLPVYREIGVCTHIPHCSIFKLNSVHTFHRTEQHPLTLKQEPVHATSTAKSLGTAEKSVQRCSTHHYTVQITCQVCINQPFQPLGDCYSPMPRRRHDYVYHVYDFAVLWRSDVCTKQRLVNEKQEMQIAHRSIAVDDMADSGQRDNSWVVKDMPACPGSPVLDLDHSLSYYQMPLRDFLHISAFTSSAQSRTPGCRRLLESWISKMQQSRAKALFTKGLSAIYIIMLRLAAFSWKKKGCVWLHR